MSAKQRTEDVRGHREQANTRKEPTSWQTQGERTSQSTEKKRVKGHSRPVNENEWTRRDTKRKRANQGYSLSGDHTGASQETERKRANQDTHELKRVEGEGQSGKQKKGGELGARTFWRVKGGGQVRTTKERKQAGEWYSQTVEHRRRDKSGPK